tara:strand:- start:413 stop:1324 length:912 start_codon:yes stop_codon:yes gene_type:complete
MNNKNRNIFTPNKTRSFECSICCFNCGKKSDYERHILTLKHLNRINNNEKTLKNTKKHQCICGKKYKYAPGLSFHKKNCHYKEEQNKVINTIDKTSDDYKDLVMKLLVDNQEIKSIMMKENQELRKQITDLIPQIGNNNNNNNTTNNVKQKFNINIFLNEKCKDAISIDQFIDTIEVSMKNLLTTRDKGLGEGLSSIIIDNMNKLSLYERPMHCTDKKRETMYIKNDEWMKDDKLEQVDKLLKKVENKQLKNIEKWTDANPNFMESENLQEEYMRLIKGCTTSIDDCRVKAIKKVCDKVYIEK